MEIDDFGGFRASEKQKKMYFALMKKLGYTSNDAKTIIKSKYKLDSFAHVDTEQLIEVINKLKQKVQQNEKDRRFKQ